MSKEIKRICDKRPEDVTMIEYQNLKLSMLNQLGKLGRINSKYGCPTQEIINPQEAIKKVQEWHKENTLKVDWSKVPVDTPIWVWEDGYEDSKVKRHFAKFEDGKIYVWNDGKTSWTVKEDKHVSKWDNAELAEVKIYE